MVDVEKQERVVVHSEGNGGPYIMAPIEQVARIEGILRQQRVSFWVDDVAISLDGKPAVGVINLGRGADVSRVQRLLDEVD